MTTPKQVNKALVKEGIKGEIYRGNGYYYFIGELFDIIPSIYSNNLHGWKTSEVINHVKKHLNQ